jgi:hypothetical protein
VDEQWMMGNRFYRDMLPIFMALAGGAGAFEKMSVLPATGYGGVMLFWLSQHNALPNAVVCSIPDALGAMLCRATPKMDAMNAAGWGTFDLEKGKWDNQLLARFLRDGVPVTVALGDHQASLWSCPCRCRRGRRRQPLAQQ